MKKSVLLMVMALVGISNAVLVNNGGFDINAADWNAAGGGGAWAPAHVATGGNPGGYVTLQAGTNVWAVWYQTVNESLAVLGIPAGTKVRLSADIKEFSGNGNYADAALKFETYNASGTFVNNPGYAVDFTVTSNWAKYYLDYTIEPTVTQVKCVLVNVTEAGDPAALYGFDNVAITIPDRTPALKPVPIVGGNLPAINDVLSWTNPDPNRPGDVLTADVFILESNTLLSSEPNLGPTNFAPGVYQVANDTTAQSVDLSDAGFTLTAGKYYYWAVHVTDPTKGVIKGFTWYFLATGDAPVTNVSAGPDQYVWLVNGTRQFTLTGTYTDDGKSPVNVVWTDISNPLEQAPGTTVTINSPNTATTTVDVDGDGWFLFSFTASDAIGSGTDTVNVGVYVDACAAAKADPADIPATYTEGHGDIDGDCDVDLNDFAIIAATWLDCMSSKLGCP
jgi:hypothetical protein